MLYADGMQMYIHDKSNEIENIVNSVNSDLEILYKWCTNHGLNLNIKKCKPIIIGHSRLMPSIDLENIPVMKIDNQVLKYEKSVFNLGLRINHVVMG
jgi:hypothetical protein